MKIQIIKKADKKAESHSVPVGRRRAARAEEIAAPAHRGPALRRSDPKSPIHYGAGRDGHVALVAARARADSVARDTPFRRSGSKAARPACRREARVSASRRRASACISACRRLLRSYPPPRMQRFVSVLVSAALTRSRRADVLTRTAVRRTALDARLGRPARIAAGRPVDMGGRRTRPAAAAAPGRDVPRRHGR